MYNSTYYPPMRIIDRFSIPAKFSIPACFAFFLFTAPSTIVFNSSSVALSTRMASRKDTSAFPNKHTFKFPSANMRNRLHPPQKWFVMLVTKDTVPLNPSIWKFFPTSDFVSSGIRAIDGYLF